MHWRRKICLLLLSSHPIASLSLSVSRVPRLSMTSTASMTTANDISTSVYELATEDGRLIRKVKPYVQEFETFAKGRWLGRTLLEVLTKEFGGHPAVYWKNAIKNGHVRINSKIVSEDYKFRNADKLLHRTHRHEPPVFGDISFVGETESLFAVSKPPSMPMHPSGAYRYNSLEFILRNEPLQPQQPTFHLVHRLDRVTSGLVVMAKSKSIAASVSQEIRDKSTKKEYLARVKGKFPSRLHLLRQLSEVDLTKYSEDTDETNDADNSNKSKKRKLEDSSKERNITSLSSKPKVVATFEDLCAAENVGYVQREENDIVEYWLDCPLGVVSHRDGIHACDPEGKPSLSIFRVLGYCAASDTTLVHCQPYTGRTHQLRLHLQLCGNPIANDPCYGGELFYGDVSRKDKAIRAIQDMRRLGVHPLSKVPHIDGMTESDVVEDNTATQPVKSAVTDAHEIEPEREQGDNESNEEFLKRTCKYCKTDGIASQLEHLVHCDGIWLHAFRYSGSTWSFQSPLPEWTSSFPNVANGL